MRRPLVVVNICGCDTAAVLRRLDQMATQEQVDQLAARITERDGQISAALDGIKTDLDALKAANPALDLTALTASVDALDQVASKAAALDAENPAPESPQN